MEIRSYKFDRTEFAGSLGDLGTLIPLSVALILINGLSATSVLLMIGLFYIFSGFYFRLPIPVQPLKLVSAIAIAFPEKVTLPILAAAGMTFGACLLMLSLTGLIDWLARFFRKPIMRGIQLGLGLILFNKGMALILKPELFINGADSAIYIAGVPLNPVIGIAGGMLTLVLLASKRFPAALVLVSAGLMFGILAGALNNADLTPGPTAVRFYIPTLSDFSSALILLVIPQMPLTLGNAVMGTADTCLTLFGEDDRVRRATYRGFSTSMGLMNLFTGMIAGMPMCHGSGGLAAHYRFGARTGGSNLMIGLLFVILGLGFGQIGISFLSAIPNAVLGVLLVFAGLELLMLIRDIKEKNDLFVAGLIAGIGFATHNMGIAFFTGIIVMNLMKWQDIKI
ncbi:sulfate permease [Desulfonema ishimotonii]|uniref:Sulfate permease n=1 Tax=Desulfonema ishimotonii TaxID=45657 RepID=A0A401FQC0_9BACT|nr:putative sulfate/molybdate transporter [Desulfonema ishimotonii]GBC59189.1 sulfate permease [Desulfonema ishimotonii]